tara:strand:+ start:130 stop:441 length:312 start_codon:yes stop_codon:yes gene_type:complete
MSTSVLTALFALLATGLGFLWRGYSKAMRDARGARDAALEIIRVNKARAKQDHTESMGVLDAKEQELENAGSHELSSAVDSLFGAGGSVPQDDAGGGGSDGPL